MNSGVRRPESKSYQRRISVATLVISPLCFHYLPGSNPVTIDSYKNVCNYCDVLAPRSLLVNTSDKVFIFQLPLSYK